MAKHLALPVVDVGRCTGCGWCVAACPPHVLSLHAQDGRKRSVLDDADHCTGCALCAVRCPFDAITMVRVGRPTTQPLDCRVGCAFAQ